MEATRRDLLYTLRHRPASDKLLDNGFRSLVTALAALVGIILFGIFLVVFWEAREAIKLFGINFLTSTTWNPVEEKFGAFTAIYGTILTSVLALVLADALVEKFGGDSVGETKRNLDSYLKTLTIK